MPLFAWSSRPFSFLAPLCYCNSQRLAALLVFTTSFSSSLFFPHCGQEVVSAVCVVFCVFSTPLHTIEKTCFLAFALSCAFPRIFSLDALETQTGKGLPHFRFPTSPPSLSKIYHKSLAPPIGPLFKYWEEEFELPLAWTFLFSLTRTHTPLTSTLPFLAPLPPSILIPLADHEKN